MNDAGVSAHVTGPKGAVIDVPLQWTGERNGEYRGTFAPTENGIVRGAGRGRPRRAPPSARTSAHVRVAPSDSEYFDAAMRAPLLRRISEETGGVHYTPQTVSSLARRREVHGPGRHDGGRARPVGHADRAVPAAQRHARPSGATAGQTSGVRKVSALSCAEADRS